MLGQRLTELRKERGFTQEDVAKLIHLTRSTYAQYEVDRRVPEYATLEKLADFFNVSIDYLVGRSNIKNNERKAPKNEHTNEIVLKEIVEKYNVDLSIPGNKEKLEKIIQIVADDFYKTNPQ